MTKGLGVVGAGTQPSSGVTYVMTFAPPLLSICDLLHGTKFEPITDDELIELPLEVKEKLSLIQLAIRNIDRVVEHAKEMLLENGRRHMGYTLYRGPTDAPDHYVIRGWDVSNGKTIHSNEAVTSPINPATLRTIREALKSLGLVCMGRMNADDPVILEVWM